MRLENGYETFTTFWMDFSIADKFGVNAVNDTYIRAFNEWKYDYKYLTELTLILNMKVWYWYGKSNDVMYKTYLNLWDKCYEYGCNNLKGAELSYYLNVLD